LLGKPLPVYGDGLQVRDWLHVEDHCAAIELALKRGRSGEVYNVGGNSETTNIQIVRTLCELVDQSIGERADLRVTFPASPAAGGKRAVDLITHVRDRLGHDRRYAIDYAKAQRELGYAPARDLASGLRATLDWYFANTRWWQALLGRDYEVWVEKNYKR
jgi:dTDP-glucose 4,6-dehydratase